MFRCRCEYAATHELVVAGLDPNLRGSVVDRATELLSRPTSIERSLRTFDGRRLVVVVVAMAALTALTYSGRLPMGPPSGDPAMFAVQVLVAVGCLIPGSAEGRRRDPVVRRALGLFGALIVFAVVSGGYRSPGIPVPVSGPLGAAAAVGLGLVITAIIVAVGVLAMRVARRAPARRVPGSA